MNDTDLCFLSAIDAATAIRQKRLSPVTLVDAFIDRIERLDPKLNAFCTPAFDTAPAERPCGRGGRPTRRRPRPPPRSPGSRQGCRHHPGDQDHLGLSTQRTQHTHRGRALRRAPQGRRRHRPRQDQHPRVRLEGRNRQPDIRPYLQSLEPRSDPRRIQRRHRRRDCRRLRSARHRHRWRRLHPYPGQLLRHFRTQANVWKNSLLPGQPGRDPLPPGAYDQDRKRQCPDARRHGRPRPQGPTLPAGRLLRLSRRDRRRYRGPQDRLEPRPRLFPRRPRGPSELPKRPPNASPIWVAKSRRPAPTSQAFWAPTSTPFTSSSSTPASPP